MDDATDPNQDKAENADIDETASESIADHMPATVEKGGKDKKKMAIIVIVILLLIVGVVAFVLTGSEDSSSGESTNSTSPIESSVQDSSSSSELQINSVEDLDDAKAVLQTTQDDQAENIKDTEELVEVL